ncbi:hypothetical protein DID73_02010 [Candidatus Marinamargulisbacteria bacterium SCGC AG-343-K17]|nr:hypothetical protein DID73_02010 [Candidatus Marinamargulisbacteria bacterium SCGC AG-343-K17]
MILHKEISISSINEWQKWLTKKTGNRIDFTRIATFLNTKNYRYSWAQLLTRASIIASTGLSAYAGYQKSESDSKMYTTTWYGLAGFILSHTIVILPLITKRHQLNRSISQLVLDITEQSKNMSKRKAIKKEVDTILSINRSTKTRAHATLTLKVQERELNKLLNKIISFKYD